MKLGTLYLVPNLLGVSEPSHVLPEHTIRIAHSLRHFACETPKAARAFLKILSMPVPIAELVMCEIPQLHQVQAWLSAGRDVGVISDAGCPGAADPGAVAVALAHALGAKVVPLVGPSSILLALMASGMNGQSFQFHGYLPSDAGARVETLRQLDRSVQKTGQTQVFIETPYRNAAMLDAIFKTCHASTALCCARELTTPQEHIVSRSLAQWDATQKAAFTAKAPALFLLGKLAS